MIVDIRRRPFPTSYPTSALLGCVDMVDCVTPDQYEERRELPRYEKREEEEEEEVEEREREGKRRGGGGERRQRKRRKWREEEEGKEKK